MKEDLKINSYITKEEFINMLQNLEFVRVENYDIQLITGFIIDNENDTFKTLGYNIEYR